MLRKAFGEPRIFVDIGMTENNMHTFMTKNFYRYSAEQFKDCWEYSVQEYYSIDAQSFYKNMYEERLKKDLIKLWMEE